jgi:trimethylamine--corrinoid protein Co-methyltransferase
MSNRKRVGRNAHIQARQASKLKPALAVWPGLTGGSYKPLTETDMEQIHQAALTLLASLGLGDPTQELLDICLPQGAHLNEHGRLCFPKALMQQLIDGAAKSYTVYGRGSRLGKNDIHCDANKVYTSTSGSAVTTLDVETETYRPSTLQDLYNFTRLSDALDNIHMTSDVVVPTDVIDDFEHDINIAYALAAGSEKPMCMSFRNRESIAPAIEMWDMMLGGEGRFIEQPFCIFGGCPIVSPLKFGADNLGVLIETSKLGLTSDIAVAPQSGATAPAPLAGILAQVVAETLACLAVVNLVNPGCGITFAAWPFVTDLRNGSFTGGSGEQAVMSAAAVQMGNFYGLPNSVPAGMTDAKTPDAQHGYEKGISITLAALSGSNRICEVAGMMASLMGCSFEAMVIDNDIIGMALRAARGIEVNEETISLNVIIESTLNPGHFLGHEQTLAYMEKEYLYPNLSNREDINTWQDAGNQDIYQAAKIKVQEILSNHDSRYIDADIDAQIRARFPIQVRLEN